MSRAERMENSLEARELYGMLTEEKPEIFAGSYLSDLSCNCRVFLFTEAPDKTLLQYTENPSFSAKQVKYSLIELRSVYDQTKLLISNNSELLRNSTHVSLDEKLNSVLIIHEPKAEVLRELAKLKQSLHPMVSIIDAEYLTVY